MIRGLGLRYSLLPFVRSVNGRLHKEGSGCHTPGSRSVGPQYIDIRNFIVSNATAAGPGHHPLRFYVHFFPVLNAPITRCDHK
jgi:hypothetical protein